MHAIHHTTPHRTSAAIGRAAAFARTGVAARVPALRTISRTISIIRIIKGR